jgi:cysteine desulfurase
MMIMLGDAGIGVSTRSACAAGALQTSHVLLAIGRDFVTAQGTLVFSFGIFNREGEVEEVVGELKSAVTNAKKHLCPYKKSQERIRFASSCIMTCYGRLAAA